MLVIQSLQRVFEWIFIQSFLIEKFKVHNAFSRRNIFKGVKNVMILFERLMSKACFIFNNLVSIRSCQLCHI